VVIIVQVDLTILEFRLILHPEGLHDQQGLSHFIPNWLDFTVPFMCGLVPDFPDCLLTSYQYRLDLYFPFAIHFAID
jgi:hypothetical protein